MVLEQGPGESRAGSALVGDDELMELGKAVLWVKVLWVSVLDSTLVSNTCSGPVPQGPSPPWPGCTEENAEFSSLHPLEQGCVQ